MTSFDMGGNTLHNTLHTTTSSKHDSDMDVSFHGNRPYASCSDIVYPNKRPTILIYPPGYDPWKNDVNRTSNQSPRIQTKTSIDNITCKHRPDTTPPDNSKLISNYSESDSDIAPCTAWCLPCGWRASTQK